MMSLRFAFATIGLLLSTPAHADGVRRWQSLIDHAATRCGVPADWIVRVMRAESAGLTTLGGRPITSRAGAMGLMQLMPGTWVEMRASLGLGADPHDPRDNIVAGACYLGLMYGRFGYPGLFAAYNAGPGRYAEALAGGRAVPAETRGYLIAVGGAPAGTPVVVVPVPEQSVFFALRASQAKKRAIPVTAPTGLFLSLTSGSVRD